MYSPVHSWEAQPTARPRRAIFSREPRRTRWRRRPPSFWLANGRNQAGGLHPAGRRGLIDRWCILDRRIRRRSPTTPTCARRQPDREHLRRWAGAARAPSRRRQCRGPGGFICRQPHAGPRPRRHLDTPRNPIRRDQQAIDDLFSTLTSSWPPRRRHGSGAEDEDPSTAHRAAPAAWKRRTAQTLWTAGRAPPGRGPTPTASSNSAGGRWARVRPARRRGWPAGRRGYAPVPAASPGRPPRRARAPGRPATAGRRRRHPRPPRRWAPVQRRRPPGGDRDDNDDGFLRRVTRTAATYQERYASTVRDENSDNDDNAYDDGGGVRRWRARALDGGGFDGDWTDCSFGHQVITCTRRGHRSRPAHGGGQLRQRQRRPAWASCSASAGHQPGAAAGRGLRWHEALPRISSLRRRLREPHRERDGHAAHQDASACCGAARVSAWPASARRCADHVQGEVRRPRPGLCRAWVQMMNEAGLPVGRIACPASNPATPTAALQECGRPRARPARPHTARGRPRCRRHGHRVARRLLIALPAGGHACSKACPRRQDHAVQDARRHPRHPLQRIEFTPDLLPSDVDRRPYILDPQSGDSGLRQGPTPSANPSSPTRLNRALARRSWPARSADAGGCSVDSSRARRCRCRSRRRCVRPRRIRRAGRVAPAARAQLHRCLLSIETWPPRAAQEVAMLRSCTASRSCRIRPAVHAGPAPWKCRRR